MKGGLMIATVLVGCVCSAMADWADPTNGWEAQYNASSGLLPDDASTNPTWTNYHYTSSTAQIVNNAELGHTVLALDNSQAEDFANYYLHTGYGAGSSTDKITLDFKVQLVLDNSTNQFQLSVTRMIDASTAHLWYFRLNKDGITTSAGTTSASIGLGWNTYRLLIDAESGLASLYMNGSSVATIESYSAVVSSATTGKISWGDGTSTVGGEANVDYIKWTNSEFAPVPEPLTFSILSGGCMAMLIKRKKIN